jgi:H+-translocating NAD(P) transhydrogenase subunit alpha
MKIVIPKETRLRETRVAQTPDTVRGLVKAGFEVAVEQGAGILSFIDDTAYADAGASLVSGRNESYALADIVVKVNAPSPEEIALMKQSAILISFMYAATNTELVRACLHRKISGFSMDAIPRISRAQKMDALSSQANLAGYKAVLLAANALGKMLPLMMTAAGTIKPSKVVIMGAGVAGLQAIATAKRLGAIVEVSDIRPETKEQIESLGARFIEIKSDASVTTEGGYVKEVTEDFLRRQKELIAEHIRAADIVITTALIPGKKAPLLVTKEMVKSMRQGSVILDMAVEQGGNCECSELDRTVVKHGVTIIGESNLPGLLPRNASELYARNITALIMHLVNKDGPAWDLEEEIAKGSLITHQGKAMHPSVGQVTAL